MHPTSKPGVRDSSRIWTLLLCVVLCVLGLLLFTNSGLWLQGSKAPDHVLQLQAKVQQLQTDLSQLSSFTNQHLASDGQQAEHLTALQTLQEQVGKLQTTVKQQADTTQQLSTEHQALQREQERVDHIVQAEMQQQDPCSLLNYLPRKELWGSVVASGVEQNGKPGVTASTAEECCRLDPGAKTACVGRQWYADDLLQWVWCWNHELCGQQCWLKRQGDESKIMEGPEGVDVRWTSGNLNKNYDVDPATLPPIDPRLNTLVLITQYGKIRIKLRPEWSESSVTYIRQLAQNPELCVHCNFYRSEPGFLLQGVVESAIPPNNQTKEGPKIMERGDIGWAGGTPGPHWFIYTDKNPAKGFGTSHTVWGEVADTASMDVVESILKLPAWQEKPGSMRFLNESVHFATTAELG